MPEIDRSLPASVLSDFCKSGRIPAADLASVLGISRQTAGRYLRDGAPRTVRLALLGWLTYYARMDQRSWAVRREAWRDRWLVELREGPGSRVDTL